jgi:hypothetical protein
MTAPQRAGDIAAAILHGLRDHAQLGPIRRALAEILPPEQEALCQVAGCRGGRVWIEVESAPLCAELRGFRREELRIALNQRLERTKIAELVFRLASGSTRPPQRRRGASDR